MTSEYPKILTRLENEKNAETNSFSIPQKRRIWKSREIILEILAERGITDTSPNGSVTFEDFVEWIGDDSEYDTMNNLSMTVASGTKDATLVVWITKAGVPDLESIAGSAKINDIVNVIAVVCHGDIKHPAKAFVLGAAKLQVYFQLYTLLELQYNISKHRLVPKHEFATKQEIKATKREYKITKAQFPKIQFDDVMVRHLAAKPGDVLKIKRPSETLPGYFDITFRVVT